MDVFGVDQYEQGGHTLSDHKRLRTRCLSEPVCAELIGSDCSCRREHSLDQVPPSVVSSTSRSLDQSDECRWHKRLFVDRHAPPNTYTTYLHPWPCARKSSLLRGRHLHSWCTNTRVSDLRGDTHALRIAERNQHQPLSIPPACTSTSEILTLNAGRSSWKNSRRGKLCHAPCRSILHAGCVAGCVTWQQSSVKPRRKDTRGL